MKFEVKESPKEIEKKFNSIKSKINKYVLQENPQVPPDYLFQELDDEFERVKKKYEKQNDQVNLLHVEHNYLWSKSFQYLHNDPTRSLSSIINAVSKLLDRHNLRPYLADKFENMLGTYQVALIKIGEKSQFIDFGNIEKEFINFMEIYFPIARINSEKKLEILINNLVYIFVKNRYDKKINNLKITYSNIGESEALASCIKSFLNILKNKSIKNPYLLSLCYEALYKLRKKQLHSLVKFVFFEELEEKKQNAQKIIDQITEEMVNYSKISLKDAKRFIKDLPPEKQNDKNVKIMITLKEIDKLTAEYYRKAYSDKDILKAWAVMDKIKQFLVIKAFKENVPLSDELLKYYSEEWSLLYVFAKICLLREEVNKRALSLGQEWEENVFTEITRSLKAVERLFKYEMVDKKDYTLKIMTSSFAGSFSEYFVHELCQEFFECGKIDEKTPPGFRDLLECIKSAKNKYDIKLNDILEQHKPDIDIHIKNKCAIFLKNSKIQSDEIKKIWREIELCSEKEIRKLFYGINFIKNIEKIEYVRKSFEKIKANYGNLSIDIFDIKDLVSVLLDELKRIGKSKLNFSQLDLYRVLDY